MNKPSEFEVWARNTGLAEVARRVSEYEQARGRKGVTYQNIQHWIKSGVPTKHVLCVHDLSGIPLHELDPDHYPPRILDPKKFAAAGANA